MLEPVQVKVLVLVQDKVKVESLVKVLLDPKEAEPLEHKDSFKKEVLAQAKETDKAPSKRVFFRLPEDQEVLTSAMMKLSWTEVKADSEMPPFK